MQTIETEPSSFAVASAPSGSEHFTYWADGSQHTAVQEATTPDITVESTFDFMGRPEDVTTDATNPSDTTTFSYEEATRRLHSISTAAGETTYSYCTDNTNGCYLGLLDTLDESLLTGV